jgi:hypothetical protein
MEPFQTVTKEMLSNFRSDLYYAGGRQLKEGDKIIFGFTIINNESKGVLPREIKDDNLALHLNSFILDDNNVLYQLYRKQ